MNTLQSLGARVLVVLLLGGAGALPARGADPFYERLLERGTQDLELGLVDEALQKLRIASFGFLDEPVLLARALTQLGRAQARTAKSSDLTDTVMRLVEIEERFGAYSEIDEALRTAFEGSLRGALPEELLTRLALFRHLAIEPETAADDAEALTPKQRTKVLEQELAADPNNAGALLALGRLYYERGKPKPAAGILDRLLAAEPQNEEALCLRAGLAIDRKECAQAVAGLDRCQPLTTTGNEDAFVLDCLASAGRHQEASAYLERIPPDRRRAPKLDRAARRLADLQESSQAEDPELPGDASVEGGSLESDDPTRSEEPEAEPTADPDPRRARPSPDLEESLATLRADVGRSRFREQLEEALEQAILLADAHPDSADAQHLAAEIAYLSAQWHLVVDYFDRGGPPRADRPELAFYLAVAHYELGNRSEAAAILRPVVSRLSRTSFVDDYIGRILENSQP